MVLEYFLIYSKYNLKKGVKLLKEAAKTDPMAMYLLGAMYEAGKGVEADLVQAKSYLEQAAKAGNPEAILATCTMRVAV